MTKRPDLHQTIRDIYLGASQVSLRNFQDFALDCLSGLIRFKSAVWASGVHEPSVLHTVHLYNQPQELLARYESGLFQQDVVRAAAVARPGWPVLLTDLCNRQQYEAMPVYASLCKPLGIEQAMATCLIDTDSGLQEFIALWRDRPDRPFSESDRKTMQAMMIHVTAAWHQARQLHLRHTTLSTAERGLALADRLGFTHTVEPRFAQLLRSEWSDWRGPALPPDLVRAINSFTADEAEQHLEQGYMRIAIRREGALYRITLERKIRPGGLSEAEYRVVSLYAAGQENKAIARALSISPSTVRNQIASAYRKLGVTNKMELARRLL